MMSESVWHMLEHLLAVMPPLAGGAWWLTRRLKKGRDAELKLIMSKGDATMSQLQLMRENDMRHIDLKLDAVKETVERTEEKMDAHVQWHLDHPVRP